MLSRSLTFSRSTHVLFSVLALTSVGAALAQEGRPGVNRDAIGSWFGRAVPVPGKTICNPGSQGCAVPSEIVMVFTVHGDGTFVGIDSHIFTGGTHTTAHGQWTYTGFKSIQAAFTFLQSEASGRFIGGFKNLFEATVTSKDRMEGSINAFLYNYTDAQGRVVLDADGFPKPNPLSAPADCQPVNGCVPLGQFSFKVRRVTLPNP